MEHMITVNKLNTLINSAIFKKKQTRAHIPTLDDTDLHSVIKCCRNEIASSLDTGIMPSPKFFEQAAVLSRKEQNYKNEIAICEMYVSLAKQYASNNNLSKEEFRESVLPKCEPLYKRMHNAKSMLSKAEPTQSHI